MKRTIEDILDQAYLELARMRMFYLSQRPKNKPSANWALTRQEEVRTIEAELREHDLAEAVVYYRGLNYAHNQVPEDLKLMCQEIQNCLRTVRDGVESHRTAENASVVTALVEKLDHVIHKVNDMRPKD